MVVLYQSGILVFGMLLLWWSGELVVRSAVQVSRALGISTLFVGFIIISIATGIPELGVAIMSLFYKVSPLSVGTIIGSNLSDVSLVLGLPALCYGVIKVPAEEYKELIFMLFLSAAVMGIVFAMGRLQWWDGIILILIYIIAFYKIWRLRHLPERAQEYLTAQHGPQYNNRTIAWYIFKLLMSCGIVVVASQLAVRSSVALAELLPITVETIGSTILAIGTSLPELAVAMIATRRKQYSLALGTSFGSVLEQATLILGFIALSGRLSVAGVARTVTPISIKPISIAPFIHIMPFMFISFAIVAYGMIRRRKINRKEGTALVGLYLVFLVYEFAVV